MWILSLTPIHGNRELCKDDSGHPGLNNNSNYALNRDEDYSARTFLCRVSGKKSDVFSNTLYILLDRLNFHLLSKKVEYKIKI
jgi:hypothetical protein